MDIAAYEVEAEIEGSHWWFAGRRRLFAAEIERAGLHQEATILDIGTSTGTNLRMLRSLGFGNVQGLDASDEAIRFCVQKGFDTVRKGDLCDMPFASNVFDFVLATDVIEHVDDDEQAMTEIARILKPGGAALITVPTFRCLWGLQDEIAQHKRRYRKSELLALVTRSGMQIERQYYFNYLLLLPIWFGRRLIRWLGTSLKSEAEVNSPAVNQLLSFVFTADTITAPALHPPFGVSALVLARKAPLHE
jgi:ubiquinone/menaquinone biosynthesis C-methylase UbiE